MWFSLDKSKMRLKLGSASYKYWSFFMFTQLDIPELVCLIIHSREDEVKNNALEALVIHPNLTPNLLCYLLYSLSLSLEKDDDSNQIHFVDATPLINNIIDALIRNPNTSAAELYSAIGNVSSLEIRNRLILESLSHTDVLSIKLYNTAVQNYLDEKLENRIVNHTNLDSEFLCLAVRYFHNYSSRKLALSKLASRIDVKIEFLEEFLDSQYISDEMKLLACDILYAHPLASTKQIIKIIGVKDHSLLAIAAKIRLRNPKHQLVLSHLSSDKSYLSESYKPDLSIILQDLDIPELCCLIIAKESDVRDICFDILLTKPDLNCEVLCHVIDSLRPVSFDKGMTLYLHIKILIALVNSPSVTAKQLYFAMERSQDETQIWIQRLLIDHPDVQAQMLYDISEEYDTDFDTMLLARQAFLKHENVDEYLVRLAMRDWYRYDEDQQQAKIKYATHPDAILSQLVYQLYFSGS
jgi:hypothetical protein